MASSSFFGSVGSSSMKTYGDRPRSFRIEEDGETYYIGSEVTQFFKKTLKIPYDVDSPFYSLTLTTLSLSQARIGLGLVTVR